MKDFTKEFEQIKTLEPRSRGIKFEQLFYDIFEEHGILASRSTLNDERTQQIDGAIKIADKMFLVEIKWERPETLNTGKILKFIGKVNSRIDGTLGLFISYYELDVRTINSARQGIKQNCIIIHGRNNILPIIRGEISLADYVLYIYQEACIRNKISVPISEYRKTIREPALQDKWEEVRDALLSKEDTGDFEWKLDKFLNQIENLPEKAIAIYPRLKKQRLGDRINYLLNSIIDEEDFRERLCDALIAKLCKSHWVKYAHEDILGKTKNFARLNSQKAERIVDNVTPHLSENLGQFEEENKASLVLDFVYSHLSDDYKDKLACAYSSIYCDSFRRDHFPQKQLANKIFSDIYPQYRWETIRDEVKNVIAKLKTDKFPLRDKSESAKLNYVIEHVTREFEKIIQESQPKNIERQIRAWYNRA